MSWLRKTEVRLAARLKAQGRQSPHQSRIVQTWLVYEAGKAGAARTARTHASQQKVYIPTRGPGCPRPTAPRLILTNSCSVQSGSKLAIFCEAGAPIRQGKWSDGLR
jgi:hypothetical protein